MSRFGRKMKKPEGLEYIEPTLEILEQEIRDKINEPHEGARKTESIWPVHQINWQRSRYVYEMYYKYSKISKEVYDYCVHMKLVDVGLIAKWKKPGYEKLCSTYVINTRNYNFGTVAICRVPRQSLGDGQLVECPTTGCRGCASGPAGERNIFGNKYGQSLAKIQVAREERESRGAVEARQGERKREAALDEAVPSKKRKAGEDEEESEDDEDGDDRSPSKTRFLQSPAARGFPTPRTPRARPSAEAPRPRAGGGRRRRCGWALQDEHLGRQRRGRDSRGVSGRLPAPPVYLKTVHPTSRARWGFRGSPSDAAAYFQIAE
ncbi:G10 protein-domain-containing protein [Pelagophyceae sp. CCMP2097]|nr:G10 protein-domain-containing protein [Pelagophyceae sp. CCMP2097]